MRQGEDLTKELADAIREAEEAKKNIALVGARYNRKFNEFWGQLFKSGHQDSRFARQVSRQFSDKVPFYSEMLR